jgi:PD-(D/E)XK nuclease superfamily
MSEDLPILDALPNVNVEGNPDKIIIALDATQLDAMQDCLYKFDLRHGENRPEEQRYIEPMELNQGIKKGKLFHDFMEYYYKARRDGEGVGKARADAVTTNRPRFHLSGLEEDQIKEVVMAFILYTENYGNELFTILDVERPFSVTLHEDDNLAIIWEGICDLRVLIQSIEEKQTIDHKTGSRKNYYDEQTNQFLGYSFASGDKVVVINEIVFTKTPSFNRQPLSFNSLMIERWRESVIDTVREYLLYRELNHFPRRIRSCNLKYPCVFNKWCKADEDTQRWLLKTDYKAGKPWDPFNRD